MGRSRGKVILNPTSLSEARTKWFYDDLLSLEDRAPIFLNVCDLHQSQLSAQQKTSSIYIYTFKGTRINESWVLGQTVATRYLMEWQLDIFTWLWKGVLYIWISKIFLLEGIKTYSRESAAIPAELRINSAVQSVSDRLEMENSWRCLWQITLWERNLTSVALKWKQIWYQPFHS